MVEKVVSQYELQASEISVFSRLLWILASMVPRMREKGFATLISEMLGSFNFGNNNSVKSGLQSEKLARPMFPNMHGDTGGLAVSLGNFPVPSLAVLFCRVSFVLSLFFLSYFSLDRVWHLSNHDCDSLDDNIFINSYRWPSGDQVLGTLTDKYIYSSC